MADSIVLETVRIVSTPGVLSGKPRIDGTRMSVEQIAEYHAYVGWPVEEIAEAFRLTLGQIHVALAYYYDHRTEMDKQIRDYHEHFEKIEREQKEFAGVDDVLSAVISAAGAAQLFHIDPRTVRDAIENGKLDALKSGGTWLIRRADAEARWGKRK